MLREHTRKAISDVITNTQFFDANDFNIFGELNGSSTSLSLIYKFDESKYFFVAIPNQQSKLNDGSWDFSIRGKRSPGAVSSEEQISFVGARLFKEVAEWLSFVQQDLIAVPINRKLEKQQLEIQKLEELLKDIPNQDEFFTDEEGTEIKKKLEQLQKQFEEFYKEHTDKKEKLQKVKMELNTLRETVSSLRKKNWIKSFVVRTVNWVSNPENKKLIESGVKVAQLILPDSVKQEIEK